MPDTLPLPEGWAAVARPPSLFRRFTFEAYDQTRAFLDRMAGLSEATGLYPDLGFGKTYVNVTIHGEDGAMPGQAAVDFASHVSEVAEAVTAR